MAERSYQFTVMLNDDHSNWRTVVIKANNANAARRKLEKKLAKIATAWKIDDTTIVE